MMIEYDFIYLTNTPSFYKLNLCQAITERGKKVLLVLYGYGAEAVNNSLNERGDKTTDEHQWKFDWTFINDGDANTRNKFKTFWKLLKLMRKVKAKKVLFAGWLAPEYNIYAFLSPRHKNVIVCESSLLDVCLTGIKGWIKRRIIGRMSAALPSGKPHRKLFEAINFNGKIEETGSVGIINKSEKQSTGNNGNTDHTNQNLTDPKKDFRYIYVGRLIDVKNLPVLITAFNDSGRHLTIIGKGDMEPELRKMAYDNIKFTGFIDNEQLGKIYQSHDAFILPSKSETWGLVVDEAIYWGLPVAVSDRIGSGEDLVEELGTGVRFRHDSPDDLNKALDKLEANYNHYKAAVDAVDFSERDRRQVNAYLSILD